MKVDISRTVSHGKKKKKSQVKLRNFFGHVKIQEISNFASAGAKPFPHWEFL